MIDEKARAMEVSLPVMASWSGSSTSNRIVSHVETLSGRGSFFMPAIEMLEAGYVHLSTKFHCGSLTIGDIISSIKDCLGRDNGEISGGTSGGRRQEGLDGAGKVNKEILHLSLGCLTYYRTVKIQNILIEVEKQAQLGFQS